MKNIELFFKENLDGKEAYVSCGGLLVQGTIEQKCKLELTGYYGLTCSVKLKFNQTNVAELVRAKIYEVRQSIEMSYAAAGDLYNELIPMIQDTYVKVASIYPSKVVNMNVTYRDNIATDCELKYDDGSIIKIRCINPIKNI